MSYTEDFVKHCSDRSRDILGLNPIDPVEFSNQYFNTSKLGDLSTDPNANVVGISPNNYYSELAKPAAKKFFFTKLFEHGKKLYPNFSLKDVYDGTIYIHDSTKIQPYCFGTSATEIALFGRPHSVLPAAPPKRLESFMGQITEFIMENSQEFAGAVAMTDLVPWMAWFIEKGKGDVEIHDPPMELLPSAYTDKDIENIFQSFVHVLNNSFRVGGDSPFTNISVNSKTVYYDIFDHYVFPDGKVVDDLWGTIKRVQQIIVKFMHKGRSDGLPYKFPILTANFKSDIKEAESDWFRVVTEYNADGFMNINFAERFAMCCRLSLDLDFKQNSFGGGGVKVGSMRVGNLNLPRIAYKSTNKEHFYELLKGFIKTDMEYLTAYRDMFKEQIDVGYLKFFKAPSEWYNINMFFATVGFCGIWDAAEIISTMPPVLKIRAVGGNFQSPTVKKVEIMEHIIEIMVSMTKGKSNGIKFNVEEVPSESAAGRMAKFNRDFGETKEYYSNQFIPLSMDIPLHKRIEYESRLQSKLTGGGMTFLNFDSTITADQSYQLHKYMLDEGFTGQFCINYGYSHCPVCAETIIGKTVTPCKCGRKYDFYTRVVGYLANVKDTATSKAKEIGDRIEYVKSENDKGKTSTTGSRKADCAWKESYCV